MLTREPSARFKSTEPDKTRSTTEELRASSLTREFGSTVARLLSVKEIIAEELEVTISSPATTGNDVAAVAGTALPFNVSGPELLTLPRGPAAITTTAVIMMMTRHRYFMISSCDVEAALHRHLARWARRYNILLIGD